MREQAEHATEGTHVQVQFFDESYPATVSEEPLYDAPQRNFKS
jgi:hypothetical protein